MFPNSNLEIKYIYPAGQILATRQKIFPNSNLETTHTQASKLKNHAAHCRAMPIYSVGSNGLARYNLISIQKEKAIEEFIEKNPKCLRDDLFIIGRQVKTADGGIIDLMGLDAEGNVVVIEIKKDSSPRKTIAQILEYAVWAEKQGYDELNQIAKKEHLGGFADIYKKFEEEFGCQPDAFNQNQTLYIVAPQIGYKTFDMCEYMSMRGVQIRCVEFNIYENNGEKIISVDTVIGDEDGGDNPREETDKSISWKDKMTIASEENRKNVMQIIKEIEQLGVTGSEQGRNYRFDVKDGINKTKTAAIICNKDTATVVIRINPDTFDIEDDRIRHVKGSWFFKNEARISLVPENFGIILRCIKEHSIKAAEDMDSSAANKAIKTRKGQL